MAMQGLCGGWSESGCAHIAWTVTPTDKMASSALPPLRLSQSSVSPEARQQILQPLSVLRPKFRVRGWTTNVTLPHSNGGLGPGRSTVFDRYSEWVMNCEKGPSLNAVPIVGSRLHRRSIRETIARLR